jgi:hypothetical protein
MQRLETIGEEKSTSRSEEVGFKGLGYIIRCMENEYGNATSVVFPYLEVRQTERIGDQLHQESQELAKLHEGCL